MRRNRRAAIAATALGFVALIISVVILGNHYYGTTQSGPVLSSSALPSDVAAPTPPDSTPVASASPSAHNQAAPARNTVKRVRPSLTAAPQSTCVPVRLVVPGHNADAQITANNLNSDGSLYVPPSPRVVSWSQQDVAPGGSSGTAILIGHINYAGVEGAFSDLASYQAGQTATVICASGSHIQYVVAAQPISVKKAQLGPRRQELFDQTNSYGPAGQPKTGRLLFLSCGGPFDNRTGEYEDNVFVYLLPA